MGHGHRWLASIYCPSLVEKVVVSCLLESLQALSCGLTHNAHQVCTDNNSTRALSLETHVFTLVISLILRGNLAWPINLTCTCLECGRKPEHPEETHTNMGRMCKLHTDSDPRPESDLGPWHSEAAVLTTMPPCCPQILCMFCAECCHIYSP